MMPITDVLHWLDTSKPLELATLYKFCTNDVLNMKNVVDLLLSRLCYSLFGLAIRRLGENNMG
jgi:uncharacterized protein YprB with RNaseH-like and TPR domain